jgi:hypothetical protein
MAMVHASLATGGAALSARPLIGMTGGEEGFSRWKEENLNPSPVRQEGPSKIQKVNACYLPDAVRFSMYGCFYFLDNSGGYCCNWGKVND